MPQKTDAVIAELMDRRLLNDVDPDLHQEIAKAVVKAVHTASLEDDAVERVARVISRAMLDNPTGGTSEERAAKRKAIATEYAAAYVADLATGLVAGEAEPEYIFDDPRFNKGVQHVVDLIARELGVTDWVAGDGSEDYDCDLWQTILNILAEKRLYDADEGEFAVVSNDELEAAIRADEREKCAKIIEPKRPRPCDCEWCDCHNQGDAEAVAVWDADTAAAAAIRSGDLA